MAMTRSAFPGVNVTLRNLLEREDQPVVDRQVGELLDSMFRCLVVSGKKCRAIRTSAVVSNSMRYYRGRVS